MTIDDMIELYELKFDENTALSKRVRNLAKSIKSDYIRAQEECENGATDINDEPEGASGRGSTKPVQGST